MVSVSLSDSCGFLVAASLLAAVDVPDRGVSPVVFSRARRVSVSGAAAGWVRGV